MISARPTHPNFRDIEGMQFGRLFVRSYAGKRNGRVMWECLCECGTFKVISSGSITMGHAKSCGCLAVDAKKKGQLALVKRNTRHMLSNSHEHRTWVRMRWRCTNPNCDSYPHYGGRGIRICERWSVFENFLADVGNAPSKTHSIDRIDVNGNYCPENCRWATPMEQCNNRRSSRFLTHDGQTKTVTEWARYLGVDKGTIFARLRLGWSVDKALMTPIDASKSCKQNKEQQWHDRITS